jgi:hypothetical protein
MRKCRKCGGGLFPLEIDMCNCCKEDNRKEEESKEWLKNKRWTNGGFNGEEMD